ncbi:complex I subunit 5 family protein [Pyrobaculum neutrophilum]|uniref:NADH/Ubiquinone/plastoquinone (Complex I) n=1 Tax=Pyrobaculum neutrophilum (strain DSM 2338 / JCM 9278 / NBRC 100436 / V24Sta) TaxID=444157 RepID=B1YB18_PYRNV|nr:complex I subunit 5 family protein [Pyrobaculum neutrophilum]ACB40718.1 NADH/Ubiquinone/plastoquinone (complex I) [Pyrobaculum neutrophilum V24Sta]
MYSEVFILATALSAALALAALRLGYPAALASIASMLLFLAPGSAVLVTLPYVGEVAVAMDGHKLPFVAASVLLGLIVTFYAPRYLKHLGAPNWYYGVHALYVLSFVYIVLFENLFFVFLALELSIVTSFLLIWYFGYGNRRFVGLLYFVWAQIGSILFLIGVALTGRFTASGFETARLAFDLATFLVLLGLLVKMGTAGVHFWLPYAHAEAPTPLSALLSPIHVGLMSYWIWRLKTGAGWPLEALFLYGLATAVYGSLLVFRETDFKRALADSTVANMGLLLAAASIPRDFSYTATALLFVGHAFAKAALFMLAGIYIVSLHTREIGAARWDRHLLAVGILGFVALAGLFGINLLGKAYVAAGVPATLSAAALAVFALLSTAVYSFYLLNQLYRAGEAQVEYPPDMYAAALAAAATPYVLLAALPLWLR